MCLWQFSKLSKDVVEREGVEWPAKPLDAYISIINGIERTDVLEMRGLCGNPLTDQQIDQQFARPFAQPSMLVSAPGTLFKEGLATRFPGGHFSQIRKAPNNQIWGVLWLHPDEHHVTPDDLWEYFHKFGLNVIPGELKIRR